ncbi:hypothetical protein AHiyo6_10410 [Arthrobacter sp. Hiyo6]|nr:hypothetical protein AHiyo6_10410 [Arthrobacter sp. Hiyo6]
MARTFALQRPDATDTASMTPMPAPFLATITAIALSGIAPLLIIYATPEQSNGMSFLGPLAIAAGAGLRFSLIVGARRRRLFEMVVWLFVYVFLGVAPVIQMRLGLDTNTTPNVNHALDGTSAGIVIAGCLAFAIGVATRGAKPVVAAGGRARVVSRPRANILTLACLALFAYYATRVGFTNLFTTRTNLDAIRALVWPDRTTGALVTGATSMGLLVSSVAQIYVRRQQKNAGAPMPVLLPLISVVTLFICVNPINSPRYVFGTVMLALIAAVGAYATVKRFRIVSLAALFGMVYLFPVADMFRRSLDPTAKSQDPLESMLSGDFDSFSQITNTAEYVAANDITWGKQLLGVVFFWVQERLAR